MNAAEELLAIHLGELGVAFEREYVYAPPRKFRADFFLPLYAILVEVQGGIFNRKAHGSISGVLKDNERLNAATKAGWRMLRFSPDQVDNGDAKALISEVLDGR